MAGGVDVKNHSRDKEIGFPVLLDRYPGSHPHGRAGESPHIMLNMERRSGIDVAGDVAGAA